MRILGQWMIQTIARNNHLLRMRILDQSMIQTIARNNHCHDNLLNSNNHSSISNRDSHNSISNRDSNRSISNSDHRLIRGDHKLQSDQVVHHLDSSSNKGSVHSKCIKTTPGSVDQLHHHRPGSDSGVTWNVVWTT
jgi:hypothetical protein